MRHVLSSPLQDDENIECMGRRSDMMLRTWQKRSKGREREGVPESAIARAARFSVDTAASVWRASGGRLEVRRACDSSAMTTRQPRPAMQPCSLLLSVLNLARTDSKRCVI